MSIFEILPFLSGVLFLIVTLFAIIKPSVAGQQNWGFVSAVFTVFLIFTLYAVYTEGLLGFWPNHTQDAWGNQVWFDLLIAIGIGWVLILPRARAQNMRLPFWLLFIACSGCVGFLAMLARLFLLESQAKNRA